MVKYLNAFDHHMNKHPTAPSGFGREGFGNKQAMDPAKYLAYCHAVWADSFYRLDARQQNHSRDLAEGAGIIFG